MTDCLAPFDDNANQRLSALGTDLDAVEIDAFRPMSGGRKIADCLAPFDDNCNENKRLSALDVDLDARNHKL